MNGEILQIVALCCHANATIRGIGEPTSSPRGVAFDLCDHIRFTKPTCTLFGRMKPKTFAATPREWLQTLTADRVSHARLGYFAAANPQDKAQDEAVADRYLAAFIGGGGTWYLELVRADGQSDFLAADWQVNSERGPDGRVWSATYKQATGPSTNAPATSVADAAAQLKSALADIANFAHRQELDNWRANFHAALDAFDASKPPRFDNCADLAPKGVLPTDARMLLDACQRAWVFGGMGSWNDLGFQEPDQSEYSRVSERLYQSIVAGLIAGANASALP